MWVASFLKQTVLQSFKKLEKNFAVNNLISLNKKQLLKNFDFFKKEFPNHQIWPVLKANAYGHGLTQITQILSERKITYLVVDSYLEALKIWRVNPSQKVLLIGSILPENFPNLKLNKLALTIFDLDSLHALGKLNKKVKIHLKINTNFNRQGLKHEAVKEFLETLKKYPLLELEGVLSHLADADNIQPEFTKKQRESFQRTIFLIKKLGFNPPYIHLDATAGTASLEKNQTNAVRLGIGLYGFNPLPKNHPLRAKFKTLQPVLEFTSKLTNIIELKPGDKVGYGYSFTVEKPMMIGVLPVGYFEVFDRKLSNRGFVKYQNKSLPIIGRICMNLITIDLTGTKAKRWDTIQIISPCPKDKNSIENIAQLSGTINYEALIRINATTRRKIL